MKKTFCFILLGAIILLAGCAAKPETEIPTGTDISDVPTTLGTQTENQNGTQSSTPQDPVTDHDPWREHTEITGTPVECTVTTQDGDVTYAVNVPEYRVHSIADCSVYIATDTGYMFMLGAPDGKYPVVSNLEDLYGLYIPLILPEFAQHKSSQNTGYEIKLEDQELIDINGRQMLQARGKLCIDTPTGTNELFFMGYATQLSNGAYVYWFAVSGNYIDLKITAENMANSFTEVS